MISTIRGWAMVSNSLLITIWLYVLSFTMNLRQNSLMKSRRRSEAFWSATSTLRWLMAASRYWTHRCSRRRMWNWTASL
uniref:Putative secreted protein n=1 Tax=Ixodes ricinus TaxID=34613 RepID=A0A6B0U609_IXORI